MSASNNTIKLASQKHKKQLLKEALFIGHSWPVKKALGPISPVIVRNNLWSSLGDIYSYEFIHNRCDFCNFSDSCIVAFKTDSFFFNVLQLIEFRRK